MPFNTLREHYGAQFYLPNPDGSAAGFYRIHPVKLFDGAAYGQVLQYLSDSGTWDTSVHRDLAALKERLIPIK